MLHPMITDAYELYKRRIDNTPVGSATMPLLGDLYTAPHVWFIAFITGIVLSIHLTFDLPRSIDLFISFLPFGTLRREEVDKNEWALIGRVSSRSQLGNASIQTQLNDLKKEVDSADGDIIKKFVGAESASTMDRTSANEIVRMAKNGEFEILGVWKLDRLTRANPWESISYISQLRDEEVTLYSSVRGYFDWDDLVDIRQIFDQVVFSREWYERIEENSEEGQMNDLEQGKWPFGNAHFGYSVDENKNIHLTEEGEKVIPEIFDVYAETENRAETCRRINDKHVFENGCLSDKQIKTVLRSKLCLGLLSVKGEVVQKDENLKAVDKDVYRDVQDTLEKWKSDSRNGDEHEPVNQIAHRFGPQFVVSSLNTITTKCPKCGDSSLDSFGKEERLGQKMTNYRCSGCGWQGPLVNGKIMREIFGVHIFNCPYCNSSGDFIATEITDSQKYTYTCVQCDNWFISSHPPNKYERVFKDPSLSFEFGEEISKSDALSDFSNIRGDGLEKKESHSENSENDAETDRENVGGGPRRLDKDRLPELEQYLILGPKANGFQEGPWTLSRIAIVIEREFGVSVSNVTASRYVKEMDWNPPW